MTNSNALTHADMAIATKVAKEIFDKTDLSERKLAEKYDVKRSLVQRVKKEFAEGKWDEIFKTPEVEEEVSETPKQVKSNLTKATHLKKPAAKSVGIFNSVNGDYEAFAKVLISEKADITPAYINGQFHRCINFVNK